MKIFPARIVFATFALLFLVVRAGAAPLYIITDLGTLGGSESAAFGINASGQIAGSANTSGDAATRPILATPTAKLDLGHFGGTAYGQANSVNSFGVAVGASPLPANIALHAFAALAGTMVDLGTLGGTNSSAQAISAAGQIAGYSQLPGDTVTHAFRYEIGRMRDLGTLGGSDSFAYGINASGHTVGRARLADGFFRAFRHDGTSMASLGTAGTGDSSAAFAINDQGLIVGRSNLVPAGPARPVLFENGEARDLGTLGGSEGTAYGINNSRQIVGEAQITGDAATHAFLYQGAQITDLNTLISEHTGWELLTARGINDSGLIVGRGTLGGQFRAYLLTPMGWNDGTTNGSPASGPPRVYINGGKKVVTSQSRLRVEGSIGGSVQTVQYRVGTKGAYRKVGWKSGWHFNARLQPGRNLIRVIATNAAGQTSRPARQIIVRVRP